VHVYLTPCGSLRAAIHAVWRHALLAEYEAYDARINEDRATLDRCKQSQQEALTGWNEAKSEFVGCPDVGLNDTTTTALRTNSGYKLLQTKDEARVVIAAARETGVCAIAAELGTVEAADVARCLKHELASSMAYIFTSKLATADLLRKLVPDAADRTHFFALLDEKRWSQGVAGENIRAKPGQQHTLDLDAALESEAARNYGSLGFAVNLIHIEHRQSLLRRRVFYPLLRNTLVFETEDRMTQFAIDFPDSTYPLVSLDGGSIKSNGARTCGGRGGGEGPSFKKRPSGSTTLLDPRLKLQQELKDKMQTCEQQRSRAADDMKQPALSIEREESARQILLHQMPQVKQQEAELNLQVEAKKAELDQLTEALKETGRPAAAAPPAKKARRA